VNSTYRLNTEAIEPLKAKRADRADFERPASHLGIELEASEPAQIVGRFDKKLFCRLPQPMQVALQACLSCGGQPPDALKAGRAPRF
jgi:hypothetical protein